MLGTKFNEKTNVCHHAASINCGENPLSENANAHHIPQNVDNKMKKVKTAANS